MGERKPSAYFNNVDYVVPTEEHDLEHSLDNRGGDDDIDGDDYPIIDDEHPGDDGSLDDDLAALADDIFVIVNHYLNHPDIHFGPDNLDPNESDPTGQSG